MRRHRFLKQHISSRGIGREYRHKRLTAWELLESRTMLACDIPCLPGEIVEAEAGQLSGQMAILDDPTASGGQYVAVPTGVFASSPGSDFAEYRFLVQSAGDYRLDTVADGPDGISDSFFVTVDDQPATGYVWDVPSGWTVDPVSDRGGADPVVLSLGLGEHTVRFHLREGGTRLDTVSLVELNPMIPPAVPGEIVEAESGLLRGRFAIQSDATASGGQYVSTPADIFESAPGGDYVEFRFLVSSAADYRLDTIVDGLDSESDSFFVAVDDLPVAGYLWDVPAGWTLDAVSDRGGEDPVVLSLGVGEHAVRFYARDGGTRLDSVTLVEVIPVSPALPGETVEAEAGLLSGQFTIQNDPTASGGQYIATPNGIFAAAPGDDFAEFRFLVSVAGDYGLDTIVDGVSGDSDSFWVTVDDLPATGYLWDVPSGWAFDAVSDRGGADRVVLSLGAGEHTVRFYLREGGAGLDTVTLVDLTPITPALPGETVEAEAGLLSGRFEIQDDPTASGGQFITTPDNLFEADLGDFAEYRFLVTDPGDYVVDAIVDGPDDNSNSFWVTVDDLPAGGYLWDVPTGWTASSISDRAGADPVVLSLAAGEHTVRVHLREGDARLDTITLNEYSSPGVFSIGSSTISVDEQAGEAVVTVVRQLGSNGTITVDYQTYGGSATESVDYTPQVGTLVFEDGDIEKSVNIPITNDDLSESAENFSLTIDNVSDGGTLLVPRTATITIIDDDTILPSFDDFSDASSLTLNGDAAAVGGVLRVTPDLNNQVGTAFFSEPFNVTENTSFQTEFQFQLTGGGAGADGLVFMLQNSATGLAALGSSGGGMGYGGIDQSLAVEFDTYENAHDTNNNNISVLSDGDVTTPLQTRVAPVDLNDGSVVYVWIDYNGTTDVMAVYLSANATKPAQPLLATSADLAGRVGSQAYLGFSASTGGLSNNHDLLNWQFHETAPPVIPPPEPGDELQTETIVSNIVQPTAIDWSDNGQNMLIAQKSGQVRVMRNGTLLPTPFIDISDQVNGTRDRGLLDIAVHPDFELNPFVYLLFTYDPPEVYENSGLAGPDGKGNRAGRLIRVTADPLTDYTTTVPGTEVILLGENSTWDNFNGFANSTSDFDEPPAGILPDGTNLQDFIATDSESHTVGSVEFGPDGALYVSIGDGASYNQVDPRAVRVQDIDNLSGKILRVDALTGDGLDTNPFYNGDADANRSKVFQSGLRNPFRISTDPVSGHVYIGDVGWTKWEEINQADSGANFGWPYYEGASGVNSQTTGYQDLPEAQAFYASGDVATPAIYALNHAATGINAIVMGPVYLGAAYPSEYQGDLFFSDLGQGIVRHVSFDGQGDIESVDIFATGATVVVQMAEGPDGHLYFVDLNSNLVGRWVFVDGSSGNSGPKSPRNAIRNDSVGNEPAGGTSPAFVRSGSVPMLRTGTPIVPTRRNEVPAAHWSEDSTDVGSSPEILAEVDWPRLAYRGSSPAAWDVGRGSVRELPTRSGTNLDKNDVDLIMGALHDLSEPENDNLAG